MKNENVKTESICKISIFYVIPVMFFITCSSFLLWYWKSWYFLLLCRWFDISCPTSWLGYTIIPSEYTCSKVGNACNSGSNYTPPPPPPPPPTHTHTHTHTQHTLDSKYQLFISNHMMWWKCMWLWLLHMDIDYKIVEVSFFMYCNLSSKVR